MSFKWKAKISYRFVVVFVSELELTLSYRCIRISRFSVSAINRLNSRSRAVRKRDCELLRISLIEAFTLEAFV